MYLVKVAEPNRLSSEELVENKGAYNAIVHESGYKTSRSDSGSDYQATTVIEYRISNKSGQQSGYGKGRG